jgi:hypothetical protein
MELPWKKNTVEKNEEKVESTEEKKPGRREKIFLLLLGGTALSVTAAWCWVLFSGFWALIEWVSGVITAHG